MMEDTLQQKPPSLGFISESQIFQADVRVLMTHICDKYCYFFVQRLRSKPWTYKSKFILSFFHSFFHSFRIQFSRLYSVQSVQSVVRALTTRELYSLRSTRVHTLNTNSAHNTLRNKIGMSVGIAVVGIQQSGKVQDYWHKYRLCELEVNHE